MDTLKIVIIGAGWVALHRHLPSIRQQPQAEVTGIIDRTTENARTAAASHGITNYASIENGFETPWFRDCSICCVATPPQTHYSLVKRCLEAGKDVITEKPFVMSHAEADDLQTCARNKARILAIVHNFQFSRSASQLLSDIENKELGNIISVEGIQFSNPRRRLPRWYNALPGGLFFDESPHLLYMIDRLCKNELKLRSVMSLPSPNNENTPAMVSAAFSDTAGLPVRLSMNFSAALSEWFVTVAGTEGTGMVDLFRDIYVRLPNDGLHTAKDVIATSLKFSLQHWRGYLVPGLQHVRGSCLYGNLEVFRRFFEACRVRQGPEFIDSRSARRVLGLQLQIIAELEQPAGINLHCP